MGSSPAVQPPAVQPAAAPALPPGGESAWLHLAAEAASTLAWLAALVALLSLLPRRHAPLDPRLAAAVIAVVLAGGLWQVAHLLEGHAHAGGAVGVPHALAAIGALLAAIGLWPLLARGVAPAGPSPRPRAAEDASQVSRDAGGSVQPPAVLDCRMTDVLGNLPEAICVIRVAPCGLLEIGSVNPAFERLFGIRADLVAGRPLDAVLPPGLLASALPRWRAAAARGETLDDEVTAELPGGRRVLQMALVPLRAPDGAVDRLLVSTRDVTATRRLQQGLAESARLATIGTMCAGLAHEASQPLNTAMLWLRRVRTAARDLPAAEQGQIHRAAQVVDEQLWRAGELIGRIRALAAEDPRSTERFDATVPVAAALRVAAQRYAAEGITLSLEGAGRPLEVSGNAARLEQAILQLLSNARDAVLERRRREPLAPSRIDVVLGEAGGMVAIEVRDSGTGVPADLAEAIFDPFFTTKDPGRGSGLGLAFAAGVARAMGGGIETWNLPAGGACFRMELASALAAAARPADATAAA